MKTDLSNPLAEIRRRSLRSRQAGLWFLGQAGYIVRAADRTLVIDPYLSDAAGRADARFTRLFLQPLDPQITTRILQVWEPFVWT